LKETVQLATRVAASKFDNIPAPAREASKQALLDFIGVTIAGMEEPLVKILRQQAQEQGGNPQASIIGTAEKVNIQQATLINGSAGHAHDYDDVQMAMSGHPTVPVAPVVLALAEQYGHSGAEVINAFCAGVDTECILGIYAGSSHYNKGWHATGTLGSFGATAAAAVLLGLNVDQIAQAFGIAGTQAAGLKAQFGTMCKPLHAGHAAATGTQAATLAMQGFTSRSDILEVDQGFMDTQAESADIEKFAKALGKPSFAQDICFKYHAACYLTHSAIEATNNLCQQNAFDPQHIRAITIEVDEGHFKVCNILQPQTGLEAKFSLRFTVAMTLAGVDTSSIAIFTDALTLDPELTKFRDLITVKAHERKNADTIVSIETQDNKNYREAVNVAIPATDLDAQWDKLIHKFTTLVTPKFGEQRAQKIIQVCKSLEEQDNLAPLFDALTN